MKKIVIALLTGILFVVMGATAAQAIQEDEPGWDCRTMGNQVCGEAEFYWKLPDTAPVPPTENVPAIWPQEYAPNGPECGFWYQVDTYNVGDSYALIEDGILEEGEDYGVVISWRFEYGGDCPELVPVPTENPTVVDPCGPDNIVVDPPDWTREVTYTMTTENGVVTVTATANDGFVIEDGATTVWTFEDSAEICPTELPTPPPYEPPTLAETGNEMGGPIAASALIVLTMGVLLILANRKQGR